MPFSPAMPLSCPADPGAHRPGRGRSRPRALAAGALVPGALAALLVLAAPPGHAQPSAPEDWPCVQGYVPELSPGTFWPVPIEPALDGSWREDPEIALLARRLGEAERVDETTLAAIDAFANGVPEAERRAALTRVADGTISVADEQRARYLDGIRRYTRQQIAIAGQIESTLNRMAALDEAAAGRVVREAADGSADGPDEGSPGDAATVSAELRAEMQETLDWHERLYDQRERSVRALCERPGELEQRLSEVLRELAYRLPSS